MHYKDGMKRLTVRRGLLPVATALSSNSWAIASASERSPGDRESKDEAEKDDRAIQCRTSPTLRSSYFTPARDDDDKRDDEEEKDSAEVIRCAMCSTRIAAALWSRG